MQINGLKRRTHQFALAAIILAVLGATLVTASRASSASFSNPWASTGTSGGQQLEAQQLSGSWTEVQDPDATNGTAVQITSPVNNGALYTTSPLPAGAYVM